MPNPLNGVSSTPEQDAFYSGLSERYDRLAHEDKTIIEGFPFEFPFKQNIFNHANQFRLVQRYLEMMGEPVPDLTVADAVFVVTGHMIALQLMQKLGYTGSEDYRMMLGWFKRFEQEKREGLNRMMIGRVEPERYDEDADTLDEP